MKKKQSVSGAGQECVLTGKRTLLSVLNLRYLMNDRELFKEIISKAEKGGYKGHLAFLPAFHRAKGFSVWRWLWNFKNEIIFSHDFLKAFFSEMSEYDKENGWDWQYHGTRLVLSEDRLKYLKGFLNEQKSLS